jgi:hypothetical protein
MNLRYKIFIAITAAMCLMSAPLYPQGVLVNFSNDKSTYFWEDSIWVDNTVTGQTHLLLSNHSTATLIKKSLFLNRGDRWQKEANTNLALSFNRRSKFSWGINAYNNYSRLEDRRVNINRLGLHQDVKLTQRLKLISLFTFSETTRYQSGLKDVDQGMMQTLNLSYTGKPGRWGGFKLAYDHELNLLERTPEKSFGLNFGYDTGDNTKQVSFNYMGNYRKNKFFSGLTTFDNVTTQDRYEHRGDLNIGLHILRDLEVNLLSTYAYRRFEYRQEADEASSGILGRDNLSATFYYNLALSYPLFGRSLLKTEYIYRDSDEEYGDIFSGQNIKLGELRLSCRIRLGAKDSLYTAGTFSVTTYTGKDPSNLFSDRDRVYRLGQMAYQHKFSDYFLMRLRASYQYNHNINIAKELSANNNHNILYLAEPEVVWIPLKNLQVAQSWIMHANYIYYDYEKYENSARNTIYRKADYLVKINYGFSPRLDLLLSYRFRYEDFGQLIYRDQWAQRISWERKGHLPSFEVQWRPSSGLSINPGYSFERKHSYDHLAGETVGERILREKELFKRQKIFINIDYRPGEKSSVEFTYTRRVQKSIQFSDEDSDIFTLNIRRFF